jgi:hypothetical protein
MLSLMSGCLALLTKLGIDELIHSLANSTRTADGARRGRYALANTHYRLDLCMVLSTTDEARSNVWKGSQDDKEWADKLDQGNFGRHLKMTRSGLTIWKGSHDNKEWADKLDQGNFALERVVRWQGEGLSSMTKNS